MCGVLNEQGRECAIPAARWRIGQSRTHYSARKDIQQNNTSMNAKIKRKLNMFKGLKRFLTDNVFTPANARATAAEAQLDNSITALESAAEKQVGGFGQAGSGVAARRFQARELRNSLKQVNLTAREMEEDIPGISEKFQLPRTKAYVALKATAQSIITEATPLSADFVSYGLPATFLTDLTEMLTDFESATGEKIGGVNKRKMGTVSLEAKAALGMSAAKRLNACVRNHFRDQPEIIAAWAAARRIEAAPRRDSEEQTPPSGDPGSGSGTVALANNTEGATLIA